MLRCALLLTLAPIFLLPVDAATYIVRPDGTGDFPTIQAAVDACQSGDVVELADGVFRGAGNRDIDFGGRAITVRSQSRDPLLCTIDCQGTALEPHRGFHFHSSEVILSRVEDLSIENGFAYGAWPEGSGGAILCFRSSPTIIGCRFGGNFASWGGAVSVGHAEVELRECTFTGNRAVYRGGGVDGYDRARIRLEGCTLVENAALCGGGVGGNLYSDLTLRHSIIAFSLYGNAACGTNGTGASAECCDVFGNAEGDYVDCLAGQLGISGNISADPLFCELGWYDLRLQENSPCAPEQQPVCGLLGAWPVGCAGQPPVVYTIRPDGTGDFPTIQAAVDAARSGYVIELSSGVFAGPGNRDIDFHWKCLTLRSAAADPNACIIDCQGTADAWHRALRFGASAAAGSRVQGITLANGYADAGAGVWLVGAAAAITLEGCVLSGNRACHGAALYSEAGAACVIDCTFRQNAADSAGGAIYCADAAVPTVTACRFEGNTAGADGGALCFRDTGAGEVRDCTFDDNQAIYGGGVCLREAGATRLCGCTLRGNSVILGGGGGLCLEGGTPAVDSCLFVANFAPRGGGLYAKATCAEVTHCTFAANAGGAGGGIWSDEGEVRVETSIIAFSSYGQAVHCVDDFSVALACCDVYGNTGGDWVDCIGWMAGAFDNFSADPLFCGEGSGDWPYAIREESPCAPGNNPACGLVGAGPLGCGGPSAAGDGSGAPVWTRLVLLPNRPNPFASGTEIAYVVPGSGARGAVRLCVFDGAGRRIRTLVDALERPGPHRVFWEGKDQSRAPVGSGVFFCRLTHGGRTLSQRMLLVR
jgi:predicted outer membrane repeat protein